MHSCTGRGLRCCSQVSVGAPATRGAVLDRGVRSAPPAAAAQTDAVPPRRHCASTSAAQVPRPKVLRRLWAPLAAMGVREVRLTAAARVERSYFSSRALDEDTRARELTRGLEQAGCDTRVPPVHVHRHLRTAARAAADEAGEGALLVLAHPACAAGLEDVAPRLSELAATARPGANAVVAIGPEGGWQAHELAMLRDEFGFRPAHIGARTLTTEAAVVALLAVLKEGLGDAP